MTSPGYVGFKAKLGEPKTEEVFDYLARQRSAGLLTADYATGSPPVPGFLACVNVHILDPGKLETIAEEIRKILPLTKVYTALSSPWTQLTT